MVAFDTSGGCAGITPKPGRVLLSGTLPEEHAYSGSGTATPGGDFTAAIVRALGGGAGVPDSAITVFDVFEYAHAEVVRLGRQHPTIGMLWGEVGFPVAERPLTPSVPSVVDADGYRSDVHVVHSLSSSRAGFVEHVLLPALRDADLRVAVSAPLETSPVGRVVQIERGMRSSRRTLLLASRSSSADSDFDDVVRLASARGRRSSIRAGSWSSRSMREAKAPRSGEAQTADGEPVIIETEPFDLISAQTAQPRERSEADRPPEGASRAAGVASAESAKSAEPNVPFVEVTERPDRQPDAWVLSVDEVPTAAQLTLSKEAKRAEDHHRHAARR